MDPVSSAWALSGFYLALMRPARDVNRPAAAWLGRAASRVMGRRPAAILVLRRYLGSSALILGAGSVGSRVLARGFAGELVASPSMLLAIPRSLASACGSASIADSRLRLKASAQLADQNERGGHLMAAFSTGAIGP